MAPTAETIDPVVPTSVVRGLSLTTGDISAFEESPSTDDVPKKSSASTATTENDSPLSNEGENVIEVEGCRKIMEALTPAEREKLADERMPLRHLRAENGDVKAATTKIKSTLAWRDEFKVPTLKSCVTDCPETHSKLSFENSTGKVYARGYDREDRAVLYLRPGVENSTDVEWNLRHLVYNIERAIACTARKSERAQDKMCIVLDFYNFRLRSAPSLSTSKATLSILQDHYPERLHRAYICNPPRIFRVFWSMIKPFIDPVTKDKICFCVGKEGEERLREDFQVEKMEACIGGDKNLKRFDTKEYFETPFEYTFDEKIV